jgi:hypothetical protein
MARVVKNEMLDEVCDAILERAKGFEPSTPTLARLCSTPELRPRGLTADGAIIARTARLSREKLSEGEKNILPAPRPRKPLSAL